MNAKKAYRYLLLLFVGGLAFAGWIVKYSNTQLAATSADLTVLRKDIGELEQKRTQLEKAKVVMRENAHTVDTLSKVVPEDKDQAKIVEEIHSIADKAGVSITSVGFPASTLGSQVLKVATPVTTDTPKSSQAQSPVASQTVRNISQATPLKDIPGIQAIELSIGTINSKTLAVGSGVRYSEMMSFIRQIERNERAIQITALGIGQNQVIGGEPTFNLTISLTIFVRS